MTMSMFESLGWLLRWLQSYVYKRVHCAAV
jgi:hypothetical protein